jgi:hypothetical protein
MKFYFLVIFLPEYKIHWQSQETVGAMPAIQAFCCSVGVKHIIVNKGFQANID